MLAINEVFENISTFQPQHYENMTVVGLSIPDNENIDLMSLEIGLNMGLVEITESNNEGNVSEVKVINNAVTPLLILDGEEIIGSKQNRIVNMTIIIPPKSEKIVPVSCTEAGRWNYKTSKFHYSNHMATSRVRRDKLNSVSCSLRENKCFNSDQGKVWENIDLTEKELNVHSSTSALHDFYTSKYDDIENYKLAFNCHDNQNGLLVYINGKIVGFEIIYNTSRYKDYHEKLVESYVLDAIGKRNVAYEYEAVNEKDFFNNIKNIDAEKFSSLGLGDDYRIEDDNISGSALVYEDNLINASFFRKIKT